jgi:PDZ domain
MTSVGSVGRAKSILAVCAVFCAVSVLAGCATPFADFYNDQTNGQDPATAQGVILPADAPRLVRGGNPDEDALRMAEDGYALLGSSAFNARTVDERGAIAQGEKVHASVVILYSKYTGTVSVSGPMPIALPEPKTSPSYGTRAGYIPYAVRRPDYLATYWIKLAPPTFGISADDLTLEASRQLGSHKGMLVHAVVKGSPAHDANILRNDIITSIGGLPVYDDESFVTAVDANPGKEVEVVINRDRQEIHKRVKLRDRT